MGGINRRQFLRTSVLSLMSSQAPAIITSDRERPVITHGVQSGDVTTDRALVWARADRPARLIVEYSLNESFTNASRIPGPLATAATDFTAQIDLRGLASGRPVFYRVQFESATNRRAISESQTGTFRTASLKPRRVRLAWTADTVGQGWGINPAFGLRLYETMRQQDPDLFVHSGDMIYADAPLPERITLDDGQVWTNLVTPAKTHVAETLGDYRGNFAYNRLDAHALRFSAAVPIVAQWDDHEVTNNWYPSEVLDQEGYTERRASVLAARARQAMFEWVPIRSAGQHKRVYRHIEYGPTLDVFVLDCRTYRAANGANREPTTTRPVTMLGREQLTWLEQSLRASRATWKVIACDMPIGLLVRDGKNFEAWANADDGPPLGREHEIARVLSAIKRHRIHNTVWITGDVHYAAAHHYDPTRARFPDFLPFWEFVAGPMHAGTFGPNSLDGTFGPEVRFVSIPPGMKPNRPPSDGLQFFGTLDCDSRQITASIWDLAGRRLWSVDLEAIT